MNTVVVSNQENTVTNIQSSKGNIATDVQSNQGNVVTDIQVEFNRSQVVYKDGDYNRLTNKPSINGHELIGDKNSSQLNLLGEFHSYVTYLEFPVVPNSGWENDIFLDTTNNKIYRLVPIMTILKL